jgi:hypothetical protein
MVDGINTGSPNRGCGWDAPTTSLVGLALDFNRSCQSLREGGGGACMCVLMNVDVAANSWAF